MNRAKPSQGKPRLVDEVVDSATREQSPTSMEPGPPVERAAITFSLLANPHRLELVRLLSAEPTNVGRLVELSGFSQPNVSQHLARLRHAGLVESRRQGHHVTNYLTTPLLPALCALACQLIDAIDRSRARPESGGSSWSANTFD